MSTSAVLALCACACAPPAEPAAALIAALGADAYAARERAHAALAGRPDALAGVALAAGVHPDPEVRRRCRRLRPVLLRGALAALEPVPCLDALWYDRRADAYRWQGPVRDALAHYLTRGEEARLGRPGASGFGGVTTYRYATRALLADLLELGVPADRLAALVEVMRRRDALALGRRGLVEAAAELRNPLPPD